jgi:hypothetical protein
LRYNKALLIHLQETEQPSQPTKRSLLNFKTPQKKRFPLKSDDEITYSLTINFDEQAHYYVKRLDQ